MSKRYKYRAVITLIVFGEFEDDEHTVIADQATDRALHDAINHLDDGVEIELLNVSEVTA